VERHSDKVESIFVDLQKKYSELDAYASTLEDINKANKEITTSFDKIKIDIEEKAEKKPLIDLTNKFNRFLTETKETNIKKFTDQIAELIKQKETTQSAVKEMHQKISDLEISFEEAKVHKVNVKLENMEKTTSLLKIDVNNQKEVVERLSKAKSDLSKMSKITNDNQQIKKELTILGTNVASMQQFLTKINKKIQNLGKESEIQTLTNMNKNLSSLQKTYRSKKSNRKPKKSSETKKKQIRQKRKIVKKSITQKNTKKKPKKKTKKKKSRKKIR
jgi:hypothetical protein